MKDFCLIYLDNGMPCGIFFNHISWLKLTIGKRRNLLLFALTVSHKIVRCAAAESERHHSRLECSHSSSASALIQILEVYV